MGDVGHGQRAGLCPPSDTVVYIKICSYSLMAKPGSWFGSFLLGPGSFPSQVNSPSSGECDLLPQRNEHQQLEAVAAV